MAFRLLKKLFIEILVKSVLNGLKTSYVPVCSILLCRIFLYNLFVYLVTAGNITWKLGKRISDNQGVIILAETLLLL